jgi:hypothetical protein
MADDDQHESDLMVDVHLTTVGVVTTADARVTRGGRRTFRAIREARAHPQTHEMCGVRENLAISPELAELARKLKVACAEESVTAAIPGEDLIAEPVSVGADGGQAR